MVVRTIIASVVVFFALAGCEDSKEAATTKGAVSTWSKAGFDTTAFKDVDAKSFAAAQCKAGKVDGLHVTLCEFEEAKAAEDAKDKGLKSLGDVTGVALVKAKTMMLVADKDKVDPSGRQINKIAKAFWSLDESAGSPFAKTGE